MVNTAKQPHHHGKAIQAQAAMEELLKKISHRGFYGAASLTFTVQDGHIQHLKISTERMLR